MRVPLLVVLVMLLVGSQCFYDRFSAVKSLTSSDFQQVKKGIWLVEFYANWCGHCRNLAPEYEKAAQALKGIANIAAIEADKERTDVQVQGFPTIKFFVDGKMTDYDGPRTSEGIVDFMFRKLRNVFILLCRSPTKDWEEEPAETVRVATVQEMLEALTKKM
jgi:protein disulfide-isomerase A6